MSSFFVEIESKEGRKTAYSRHKTASTNDGLLEITKIKYRIPEPGMTISGFADSRIECLQVFVFKKGMYTLINDGIKKCLITVVLNVQNFGKCLSFNVNSSVAGFD